MFSKCTVFTCVQITWFLEGRTLILVECIHVYVRADSEFSEEGGQNKVWI